MATDKQIAANRLNALKSTGPRTLRGKAISSRNSLRLDILDKRFVLESECPERFEAFLETFYGEYDPATPTELALVNTMAAACWRLQRMSTFEATSIDHEYRTDASPESATLSIPTRATLAYRRATASGRSIELINRTEARLQHQFNSALDRLDRLRRRPIGAAKRGVATNPIDQQPKSTINE